MAHLYRTFAHILAAAVVMILIGVGVQAHGIVAGALTALVAGGVTTFIISLALNKARQILGIFQAGRLVQYALFLTTACLTLNLAAWLVPAALTVTSGWLAAAVMFAAFIVLAFVTGYINVYRGRSWLPVKNFPPNMNKPH